MAFLKDAVKATGVQNGKTFWGLPELRVYGELNHLFGETSRGVFRLKPAFEDE